MLEHASVALKDVISRAADEAARLGDRRIGTDHLLLGLLHDPGIATRLDIDVERGRAAARQLDHAALAAIGIDLSGVALPTAPAAAGHAPPTSGMRAAVARAFTLATAERRRKVEPDHLLAALLEAAEPDPAAVLLRALGVTPGASATTPES